MGKLHFKDYLIPVLRVGYFKVYLIIPEIFDILFILNLGQCVGDFIEKGFETWEEGRLPQKLLAWPYRGMAGRNPAQIQVLFLLSYFLKVKNFRIDMLTLKRISATRLLIVPVRPMCLWIKMKSKTGWLQMTLFMNVLMKTILAQFVKRPVLMDSFPQALSKPR